MQMPRKGQEARQIWKSLLVKGFRVDVWIVDIRGLVSTDEA